MTDPERPWSPQDGSHEESPILLVVDDDAAQRAPLVRLLRDEGYRVHDAASGQEGVQVARRVSPDLVLLDVRMPGMDGFETCRRLQALDPQPQVLFLSARLSVPLAVRGLEVGAADYIGKPYPMEYLLAKVRATLRTKRSLDHLAARAAYDALTGLLSRGELEARGEGLVSVAERHDRSLACLAIDIDRFKAINDSHGHAAGDAVLEEVAHRLRRACRKSDHLFRVGGEEFLVLAPETDFARARQLGERLRWTVERDPIEFERAAGERVRKHVTVSVGVAARHDGQTLEALLEEADDALYRAKDRGRNRVWGATEE